MHPEITSEIRINVARSDEEAKIQEKGKGNDFNDTKSSENEQDKSELKKMFDDESMASKINNDNEDSDNEDLSDETRELNQKKLDSPDELPKS